ncbi:MAG: hypothetical protein CBE21_05290, partial [Proteobacteria bacterium TMED261]
MRSIKKEIDEKTIKMIQVFSTLLMMAMFSIASPSSGNENPLIEKVGWISKLEGPLTNRSGKKLIELIDEANQEYISFVIIQIDTPGGQVDALRDLVKSVLNSQTPIITYVGPQGARSASAGTYLVLSSHIASMAPATNIGSSTPVLMDGSKPSEDMRNKMINDAAAYIKGLAKERGRNAEWAEQ